MFPARPKFPYFFALALLIASASAAPPPVYDLSTNSTSRIALYDDINAQFRLVYAVSSACPQTVALGQPSIDQRKVAVLPLPSVNEDGALCTGPSPINFVGEENIRRQDDLLTKLQLGGMREALENNQNANQLLTTDSPPSLLVGWHNGERRCNAKVYPRDTIYFIIKEDSGKTISLKKQTQRDVVTIPPAMRAILIVAPNSNICLLADTSSKANDDVTLTVVPDDGSAPSMTVLTPAGSAPSSPAPPASVAPAVPPAVPSPASSTAAPAGSTTSPIAASPAPPATSPAEVPITPASPVPSTAAGDPPVVAPVPGAPTVSTPTASPVLPVSGVPVATPVTSLAPSASPVGVGAVLPNESPGVTEVVQSPEDDILVENTSPPEMDDGSACFPASSTVIVEREGVKTMSELHVGDRVLTDTGFSDVILFTHRESSSRNTFIRIIVAGGESLRVSPGHYVYSNQKQLKAARALGKGDVLYRSNGEQRVIIGIDMVSAVGLFNPQTVSGSIMVDGLLASTYTTAVDPVMAHSVLMVPVRWMYQVSPWLAAVVSRAFDNGSPLLAAVLPNGASLIA